VQNIDPILILEPALITALSIGLVVYWHYRRRFDKIVLLYTLVAYVGAIAVKIVFQEVTYSQVLAAFGSESVVTGLYFGLQTVFLEVGFAYLLARYAVNHKKITDIDAESFGLCLSFWENGVYLGIISLINIVAIYLILASGIPLAQVIYSSLTASSPQSFSSPVQLLPDLGWGFLERISSLLAHFSWGYLCVFAAFFHKRSYFLLALPMGLIDFFVVFANTLTLPVFELLIFALSAGFLALALLVTQDDRKKKPAQPPPQGPQG
jgi:hypothetical protein